MMDIIFDIMDGMVKYPHRRINCHRAGTIPKNTIQFPIPDHIRHIFSLIIFAKSGSTEYIMTINPTQRDTRRLDIIILLKDLTKNGRK